MFATSKKKTVLKNFQGDVPRSANYPHRLNFYSVPPHKEITLEEFELWAIDRLYGTECLNPLPSKYHKFRPYHSVSN
jgi:hypothetical protein